MRFWIYLFCASRFYNRWKNVYEARIKAGEILAKENPVNADIVVGVPDSGLDAALGYSKASGIPYGIGLIKINISEELLYIPK